MPYLLLCKIRGFSIDWFVYCVRYRTFQSKKISQESQVKAEVL